MHTLWGITVRFQQEALYPSRTCQQVARPWRFNVCNDWVNVSSVDQTRKARCMHMHTMAAWLLNHFIFSVYWGVSCARFYLFVCDWACWCLAFPFSRGQSIRHCDYSDGFNPRLLIDLMKVLVPLRSWHTSLQRTFLYWLNHSKVWPFFLRKDILNNNCTSFRYTL